MAWSKDHGKVAKVNADYAKVQGDYAQTEANKVEQFIEDNKTKWLPAVATVAARNSAYPNPEHGDTVRVTSEAKTYRYVSPTGWVVTDIYDASAIDQVTTQLAQTEQQVVAQITSLDLQKPSKDFVRENTDVRPIDVSEFNTATKQLFTGGAVPVVGENAVGKENLKRLSVEPEKTTFLKVGKNLFNKEKVTQNFYITASSGNEIADPTYNASEFMPVKPNTYYTKTTTNQAAVYDVDKNYISGITGVKTFLTPANAFFVRT